MHQGYFHARLPLCRHLPHGAGGTGATDRHYTTLRINTIGKITWYNGLLCVSCPPRHTKQGRHKDLTYFYITCPSSFHLSGLTGRCQTRLGLLKTIKSDTKFTKKSLSLSFSLLLLFSLSLLCRILMVTRAETNMQHAHATHPHKWNESKHNELMHCCWQWVTITCRYRQIRGQMLTLVEN